MDRLWAPWRKIYLSRKSKGSCFICRVRKSRRDSAHYVLARSRHSFALLNLYPYNAGHVMVVPNRHIKSLDLFSDTELLDFFRLSSRITARIQKVMKPDGINSGFNLGRAAGAGVPGHIHLHVVPRWIGDTNFMPVIGKTKVVPEALDSVFKHLKM